MDELKYVGKSLIREDTYDKATGKTRYICDMHEPNMLYAKLVLSQKAHARIQIYKEDALNVEGVVAVFTHADVPKTKYNGHIWSPAIAQDPIDQYILSEKARFVGDPLALVVGKTKAAAEEGARCVRIIYEELEAKVTLKDVIGKKEYMDFEKELFFGDFKEAEKKADKLVITRGSTPKVHHGALEPHIALAKLDERGNLVIYTPCQTVYQVRYHVSMLLGIPYSKIRVIKSVMGGSFGGKGQTVLEPACAFAAYVLQRPVQLYMNREETVIGTRTRNPVEMTVKTAVTKDGRILGRAISCQVNGGAYYTNSSAVIMSMAKKLFRMYRMESQYLHGTAYRTNTTPGGACRGYGSPQGHAVTEVNMDQAAAELKMDPCDFRLKNLVYPYDADPTGGTSLGNAQIRACVERGRKEFDWDWRRAHCKEKNTWRYQYGVGMACGAHGNGYFGAHPEFTKVSMILENDGTLIVKMGLHDQGCGTLQVAKQIVAEATGIVPEHIAVMEADTFLTPYDSAGTQASRVTYLCGRALENAGKLLQEQIIEFCTVQYKWEKDKIDISENRVTNGVDEKKLETVILEHERMAQHSFSVDYEFKGLSNPGSYAACFTEVKIDTLTGLVTVEDFLAVHDIGQVMNRMLAEGQVSGGAHMSIGMALYEHIVVNGQGDVTTRNFSKYHMINAPDMPKIRSIFIEEHGDDGPYGGKSLGELAAVAPAPAVVNAINHGLGSTFADFPVTPEKIVNYMEEKRCSEY